MPNPKLLLCFLAVKMLNHGDILRVNRAKDRSRTGPRRYLRAPGFCSRSRFPFETIDINLDWNRITDARPPPLLQPVRVFPNYEVVGGHVPDGVRQITYDDFIGRRRCRRRTFPGRILCRFTGNKRQRQKEQSSNSKHGLD